LSEVVQVKVWGDFACFTRPEFPTERVSYDVPTPSATRGVLEAIFWKPEFSWQVREIRVLNPVRWFGIVKNEVEGNYPANPTQRYFADRDRAQRHTLMLRDVAYVIKAEPRGGNGINVVKYLDQFRRRVRKGQCFHQPYGGIRECVLYFEPPDGSESPIDVTTDLGPMLWDFDYTNQRPLFFDAHLRRGVMRVPPREEVHDAA
jgi:CRISPR-associated protein Cas5d